MDNKQFAAYILQQAKAAPYRNYRVYEQFKKQIQGLCLSPASYEAAVKELAEILFL
ncbi:MAG: hypothetical protein RR051_02065 [Clostridiales bacterium]